MDRNVLIAEQSSSDAICHRKCDTRIQERPLENSAFMLAMYPQQSPCILLKFQSVTKKPNKTLLQTKHTRNKSLDILSTMYPKLPPQNYIEQTNGSVSVMNVNAATSLWSLGGLSFCSYIKTPSNFRFSKLSILSQ